MQTTPITTLAELEQIFSEIEYTEQAQDFVYLTLLNVLDEELQTPSGEDAYELYKKANDAIETLPSSNEIWENQMQLEWEAFRILQTR